MAINGGSVHLRTQLQLILHQLSQSTWRLFSAHPRVLRVSILRNGNAVLAAAVAGRVLFMSPLVHDHANVTYALHAHCTPHANTLSDMQQRKEQLKLAVQQELAVAGAQSLINKITENVRLGLFSLP